MVDGRCKVLATGGARFVTGEGPGCRVQGTGYSVWDTGCRVQGTGCRVQGPKVQGPGSRVQGAGCRVQGAGSGVRVQGSASSRVALKLNLRHPEPLKPRTVQPGNPETLPQARRGGARRRARSSPPTPRRGTPPEIRMERIYLELSVFISKC